MASMNNWLASSLSPQELLPQPVDHQDHHSCLRFNSNEISGADVSGESCFDLPSPPSLNIPPPLGLLEAFNRNNQSQYCYMKGLGMNSDGNCKTTSELSMLMGSSCNSQIPDQSNQVQEPKLENFLGNHSFSTTQENKLDGCNTVYNTTTGEYMFPNCSMMQPLEDKTSARKTDGGEDNNNNTKINTGNSSSISIGLSRIKTWLRNQPAPTQAEANNNGSASQSLSLSMSTGSQTGSPLPLLTAGSGGGRGGESSSSDNNQQQKTSTGVEVTGTGVNEAMRRKCIDTFGQRTSIYRGVTRHRWTGRYEAHLWDNSSRREGQTRRGRQVYLGGYDKEEKAARAYDLAAIKYWGTSTTTNFPLSNYEEELEEMKHMTRQEYVVSLRRKSSGFSRGASIYRGVTRHHQHGRWQARIGRVAGNKDLYLGTFSTQEEAAEAYDIAAIKFRGPNAVTNFDMSRYDLKSILESSTLPVGGAAKRLKDVEQAEMVTDVRREDNHNISTHFSDGINDYGAAHHGWPTIVFQQAQRFRTHNSYGHRVWCKQEQDSDENHTLQDFHQLHLGSAHNFFQPSVLHDIMAMDSSPIEHRSGSTSVIYSNGATSSDCAGINDANDSYQGVGYGGINGVYVIPLGTAIASDGNQNQGNGFGDNEVKALIGYENLHGSAYLYHSPRSSNMAVSHGTPNFTAWNDT